MSPRPLPDPRPPVLLGWLVFGASWCAAGVVALLVGVKLAQKRWPAS